MNWVSYLCHISQKSYFLPYTHTSAVHIFFFPVSLFLTPWHLSWPPSVRPNPSRSALRRHPKALCSGRSGPAGCWSGQTAGRFQVGIAFLNSTQPVQHSLVWKSTMFVLVSVLTSKQAKSWLLAKSHMKALFVLLFLFFFIFITLFFTFCTLYRISEFYLKK